MKKALNSIETKELVESLTYINELIATYSDVPMKAMNDYEVEDMVKLRCGYELISAEVKRIKIVLGLD